MIVQGWYKIKSQASVSGHLATELARVFGTDRKDSDNNERWRIGWFNL